MPEPRWSRWLPGLPLLVVWLASVGWPLVALLLVTGSSTRSPDTSFDGAFGLLLTSMAWAAIIAVGAAAVGWAPGRVLGRALGRRRSAPFVLALLAPICLPAYVVFWLWWQASPPDSALAAWASRHDAVTLLREATLVVSLIAWAWPLVAWCVAGCAVAADDRHEEHLRLDGAGRWSRLVDRFRRDSRGLAIGGLLVFVAVLGNTTSFDLAQVYTLGNQIRAMRAVGATPADLLVVATPGLVVLTVLVGLLWWLVRRRPVNPPTIRAAPGRRGVTGVAVLWLLSLAAPILLFATRLPTSAQVGRFVTLYGDATVSTVVAAAVIAAIVGPATVLFAWLWQSERAGARRLADGLAVTWLLTAFVPATIIAVAIEAAYNRAGFDTWLYLTPAVLGPAWAARFMFIATLFGHWLAHRESIRVRDARRLDGAMGFVSYCRGSGPRLAAAMTGAGLVTFVFALSEIHVSALLMPPAFDSLALALLNAMHYQRPDIVLIATAGLLLACVLVAVGLWVMIRTGRRGTALATLLLLLTLVVTPGCDSGDGEPDQPLRSNLVFGAAGQAFGQFDYPRACALDPASERLYIVDKSARVQRFTLDGKPEIAWRMPAKDNGKPTGIAVAPDGRVFVADTHYWRIIAFDPDGTEVLRFGGYGEDAGQFIYPTDIAFAPDGRLYVAEYGGNDRVQVFEPDGTFVFEFGTQGEGDGEFNRPQSMLFGPDGAELFIADACNHRIVVTDPQGRVLRTLGEMGREPGQLAYPYDLTRLDDGSLLIAEFGNNRIQRLDAETGASLGVYGRLGAGEGEVRYPWGVASLGRQTFVLDSGNNRVQRIRTPR